MDTYTCPHCGAENSRIHQDCVECGAYLIAARLTSLGEGVIANGRILDLPPTNTRVGRDPEQNDFVIRSNLVSSQQAVFTYTQSGFELVNLASPHTCLLNDEPVSDQGILLHDGDRVKIGVDTFTYSYFSRQGPQPAHRNKVEDIFLQAISDLLSNANAASNLNEIFVHAADALLAVSNMERAIGYFVEDPADPHSDFQALARRLPDRQKWDDRHPTAAYPVCYGVVNIALDDMYPIYIASPEAELIPDDDGIGYKSIICIPMCIYDAQTGRRQVHGVLYADSRRDQGEFHEYTEPSVGIIGQIITMLILEEEAMRDAPPPPPPSGPPGEGSEDYILMQRLVARLKTSVARHGLAPEIFQDISRAIDELDSLLEDINTR